MSNNSDENGFSINDAVDSLLSPPTDTVKEERQEPEMAQPVETEAEAEIEDNSLEPEIEEEEEVYEAEDAEVDFVIGLKTE